MGRGGLLAACGPRAQQWGNASGWPRRRITPILGLLGYDLGYIRGVPAQIEMNSESRDLPLEPPPAPPAAAYSASGTGSTADKVGAGIIQRDR